MEERGSTNYRALQVGSSADWHPIVGGTSAGSRAMEQSRSTRLTLFHLLNENGILKRRQVGPEQHRAAGGKEGDMAKTFPPAIKALAHKHRLGTPVQLYTHVVSVRFLFGLLIFWVLLDMLFTIAIFFHTGPSKDPAYKNPVSFEVLLLVITAVWFSVFWSALNSRLLPLHRGVSCPQTRQPAKTAPRRALG
jgi:hypothetical protein